MPFTSYVPKKFTPAHEQVIEQAREIIDQYEAQGLSLTLRQVYYQFVARGWLPNKQNEYKRLGEILNDARLAGEIDWLSMVDRTRSLREMAHHKTPADLIEAASETYLPDLWQGQHHRVEVWIEKDAGIGVIEQVCRANDVAYFSCRGYTSQSEMWAAAQRLRFAIEDGNQVTVLHIGDHDPSGVDMSRDIEERLRMFMHRDWSGIHLGAGRWTRGEIKSSMRETIRQKGGTIEDWEDPWSLKRIALTVEQIERYNPPPNPAKQTDSRFLRYAEETGLDQSWELDALDPFVLQGLIQDEIDAVRDEDVWAEQVEAMETARATLREVHRNWTRIAEIHKPKGD